MRTILHSDLNNFYASCEAALNPALKNVCLGVTGSVSERHGIILAKNDKAKAMGVKTGMTIKNAKDLCPDIVLVEANFETYLRYSERVRKIYLEYTDRVEPFGIDEAWLDLTHSLSGKSGVEIADEIRARVKEIGLTVSVGVSFNKVFAKLGSDMKKPDATTVISYDGADGFRNKVWQLGVGELLMVGKKSEQKLKKYNINTIGDLARTDVKFLTRVFGKNGATLHAFACGEDNSEVRLYDLPDDVKSVSSSMTSYRDLVTYDDVHIMFSLLSESVSSRVIRKGLGNAGTVSIFVRDEALQSFTRQAKLVPPSSFSDDIFALALKLFTENYDFKKGVRSLGISVSDFVSDAGQISMFDPPDLYDKKLSLAKAVIKIKDKYGSESLTKAVTMKDKLLSANGPEKNRPVRTESFPTED